MFVVELSYYQVRAQLPPYNKLCVETEIKVTNNSRYLKRECVNCMWVEGKSDVAKLAAEGNSNELQLCEYSFLNVEQIGFCSLPMSNCIHQVSITIDEPTC